MLDINLLSDISFANNCFPFSRLPFAFVDGFLFSASSPTSVVSCVVNFSHSDRCEVVSQCGFDLYFPDDE